MHCCPLLQHKFFCPPPEFICDISYDIMEQAMISYMISYMEITWMLCLFSFPAYMACNVGYLIPSSQAPASPSLSIQNQPQTRIPHHHHPRLVQWWTDWLPGRANTAGGLHGNARSTVRYTSLLFVQSARRLQLSIWLCSGPWWLKFSDQPKSRISRTL